MFLAFPFLHSKVKRSSGIKIGLMWTDFTIHLSNIGIMFFGKELLISFYMSRIFQISWFFNFFFRHSILLKHCEFFNVKSKLKYFHKIVLFILKNYLTLLLDLARYTLFCNSLAICPLIMKLSDPFPKCISD